MGFQVPRVAAWGCGFGLYLNTKGLKALVCL